MRHKSEYYLESKGIGISSSVGKEVYRRVCRTDFRASGFVLLDLARVEDSQSFRRQMVQLKEHLSETCRRSTGRSLGYMSLVRSDQQETTRPHRDGGPDESLLMLGYEPTRVRGRLRIADHTQCAHDLGLTPEQFLSRHNPMFAQGEQMLASYTTDVEGSSGDRFQVLVINNSNVGIGTGPPRWLGVLHQALIDTPLADQQRIVNSTMILPQSPDEVELLSRDDQERFVTTDQLSRKVAERPR